MIQECKIGEDNQHALEVDDIYTGNVILNSSSRIVSMLSFNNFGFVSVFTATDDNQVHKVMHTMGICVCCVSISLMHAYTKLSTIGQPSYLMDKYF